MLTVCGAIKVSSIEEMLETAMALRYVRTGGSNAALIAVSGGHSGKIADVFGQQGFRIPAPSATSLEEIASYAEIEGGSYSNPVEGPSVRGAERMGKTLGVFARDDNFDMIVVEFGAGAVKQNPDALAERIEVIGKVREQQPDKPIVTVLSTDIPYVEGVDIQGVARDFFDAGLPCFLSMERGAVALQKSREFQRRSTWLLPRSA